MMSYGLKVDGIQIRDGAGLMHSVNYRNSDQTSSDEKEMLKKPIKQFLYFGCI